MNNYYVDENGEVQVDVPRYRVLCDFLNCSEDDLEVDFSDELVFEYGNQRYLVLRDYEADKRARKYILDSIWAFNPSFLESHTGIDKDTIKIIQEKCEDANEPLKRLIKDLDHFVNDAILADGRGHFLASYDFEEHYQNGYYIYRTN
jgi:hypothetical protein